MKWKAFDPGGFSALVSRLVQAKKTADAASSAVSGLEEDLETLASATSTALTDMDQAVGELRSALEQAGGGTLFSVGSIPPENTKLLWIDTAEETGGLKYYDGSAWTAVPVVWG